MNVTASKVMMIIGALLVVVGAWCAKAAFDYDTTVYSPSSAYGGGSSVYNMGLQQEQMMRLALGCTLMIMGTILGTAGTIVRGDPIVFGHDTVASAPDLTPDELAELEEDEAYRRRVASWMLSGGIVGLALMYVASNAGVL